MEVPFSADVVYTTAIRILTERIAVVNTPIE